MPKIVSIHSYRGGTGKSNTAANMATLLAIDGRRVGVVDMDTQSPGIYGLFGRAIEKTEASLNDYLRGKCSILQVARNVTGYLGQDVKGEIFIASTGDLALVQASGKTGDSMPSNSYSVEQISASFRKLVEGLKLDVLLIDTPAGLGQTTLLAFALSDALAILLRTDQLDFQGTAVTVEVARKLGVPRVMLVVNKAPIAFDFDEVKTRIEKAYHCDVAAMLPHSDEMMTLASTGIFVARYPAHLLTHTYRQLIERLIV
ncbi:MAG: MinD/ParA family protein [Anaerolineae bacterium]|nr:MinD/ParA family protein [Anaerolineae bacterium]